MSKRLDGKVALITGGGSGIGRATAALFAREGARVMVVGRREPPLQETVALIESEGGTAQYYPADISLADDVQRFVGGTVSAYGRIDVLYNNAAVFVGTGKTIVDLTEEEWDQLMAVNLRGVFLCCKAVIPHMIRNGGGVVINCSSVSGHRGQRAHGAYNVAKGGIEILTRCLALDFAEHNIRVNAICPAWVEIDANREQIKARHEELLRLHPIGRIGQPEDIAPAALYLASDESSWVTGTSLFVDGGYSSQ